MSACLRVLFLTHRLPYAPNRGDRIRAYFILRALAAGSDVTVASLVHDAAEAAQAPTLAGLAARTIVAPIPRVLKYARGIAALASARPLTTALLSSPALPPAIAELMQTHPPDVVLAYCSSMARVALEPPLDRVPVVIDMVDADSAKWRALAEQSRWPMSWLLSREAQHLGAFEAKAMRRAHATLAVNQREVGHLRQLAPDARIEVLESGVDLSSFAPPADRPSAPPRVVFCGVMDYPPNEAGAVWLATEVWPLVRRAVPHAELRIVGSSPTTRVRSLASRANAITVTGSVPDVRPELWAAAVATAPLKVARGVQTKVLEAVAAGLLCVITSAVRGGLPEQIMPACSVADDAGDFADAIVTWLRRPAAERREVTRLDLSELAWDRRLKGLLPLLREAAHRRT